MHFITAYHTSILWTIFALLLAYIASDKLLRRPIRIRIKVRRKRKQVAKLSQTNWFYLGNVGTEKNPIVQLASINEPTRKVLETPLFADHPFRKEIPKLEKFDVLEIIDHPTCYRWMLKEKLGAYLDLKFLGRI